MATRTTTFIFNNSSDANFRAWGSWMSASFTAFSWVSVYSNFVTGTNWTDVTAPAGGNATRVTEIWRMADAAQSTAPLFLKIEYGSGSAAATPGIRCSFGTGHDGAGNLTGGIDDSGATYIAGVGTNANVTTHYASGDSGRIWFSMVHSGTAWSNVNSLIFSLERRKNASGVNQTTGFLTARAGGSNVRTRGATATGAHPVTVFSWGFAAYGFSVAADLTFDSKTGVFPFLYLMGPNEIGLNIVGCSASGNAVGGTFTCTALGGSHTYLASQFASSTSLGTSSVIVPAFLYE